MSNEIKEETRRTEHIIGLIRSYFPRSSEVDWKRIYEIIEWEIKQSLFQEKEKILKELDNFKFYGDEEAFDTNVRFNELITKLKGSKK